MLFNQAVCRRNSPTGRRTRSSTGRRPVSITSPDGRYQPSDSPDVASLEARRAAGNAETHPEAGLVPDPWAAAGRPRAPSRAARRRLPHSRRPSLTTAGAAAKCEPSDGAGTAGTTAAASAAASAANCGNSGWSGGLGQGLRRLGRHDDGHDYGHHDVPVVEPDVHHSGHHHRHHDHEPGHHRGTGRRQDARRGEARRSGPDCAQGAVRLDNQGAEEPARLPRLPSPPPRRPARSPGTSAPADTSKDASGSQSATSPEARAQCRERVQRQFHRRDEGYFRRAGRRRRRRGEQQPRAAPGHVRLRSPARSRKPGGQSRPGRRDRVPGRPVAAWPATPTGRAPRLQARPAPRSPERIPPSRRPAARSPAIAPVPATARATAPLP